MNRKTAAEKINQAINEIIAEALLTVVGANGYE